jgi:hypothetical protein
MQMIRNRDGIWELGSEEDASNVFYVEALTRYLNIFDPVFSAAIACNEFHFLSTLFAIRGLQDAGWDPYETTLRALKTVGNLHRTIGSGEAQRHLELWLYGHIVEASEPYELVANLLGVAAGEPYMPERFPDRIGRNGRRQALSPGDKAAEIERLANQANLPDAVIPLREMRDRELRNSIFHSDYSLWGSQVRIRNPFRIYTHEEISTLSNRALAYLEAVSNLHKMYLHSYSQPKIIATPPDMGISPTVVLVSEGYGAVGLQAALSKEEIANGHILWRLGRFTPEESKSLESDPTNWMLPARTSD